MKTAEEFMSKLDKEQTENGCWLWKAGRDGNGYGTVNWQGKVMPAHRAAYLIHNNLKDLPKTTRVKHTCDKKLCMRGDHLITKTSESKAAKANPAGHGRRRRAPVPLIVVDRDKRLKELIIELTSEAEKLDKDRKKAIILCAKSRAAIDNTILELAKVRDGADRNIQELTALFNDQDLIRLSEEGKLLMEEGE